MNNSKSTVENKSLPANTIERLVWYRRLLERAADGGASHLFSHELAEQAGNTAAQVRRDLMTIGYTGSPAKGYAVGDLIEFLNTVFKKGTPRPVALAGIGNLGRALISHIGDRRGDLRLVAAFDNDARKVDRAIGSCVCYPMQRLTEIIVEHEVQIGMLAVPAMAAQHVADLMLISGVVSLLNFAPTTIRVPAHAVVENVDITMKLERLSFYCGN